MKSAANRRARKTFAVTLVAGLAVIGLVVAGAMSLMSGSAAPPPREQRISVISQPPPPPPPPPKVEEPPPPEEPEIEPPQPDPPADQAADNADDAPPGDQLGLDGDGSGSGDGFGLVGKKGGRGLVGGGDRNRWYAGLVQQELQRMLSEDEAARSARYSAVVKLWLAPDGSVGRFDLSGRIEQQRSDEAVRAVLGRLRMSDAPPEDLPQPIKLRISSR